LLVDRPDAVAQAMRAMGAPERKEAINLAIDRVNELAAYVGKVAESAWDGNVRPLRELSIETWNDAADLRRELDDRYAPAPVALRPEMLRSTEPILPQHQPPSRKTMQGSVPAPQSPQEAPEAATRLADAATEPTLPASGGAATDHAPAAWDGGLVQTPLEQAASTTLPADHGASPRPSVSPGSPVSSPLRNDVLVTDVRGQTGVDSLGSDTADADSFANLDLDASVLDNDTPGSSGSLSA